MTSGFVSVSYAQNSQDTISNNSVVKVHSPKKASLYSTAIPGLGQAYNKKYWKIPFIYAGFGGLIYMASWNNNHYVNFKSDYKDYLNGEYDGPYLPDQLLSIIDEFRRNRDLSFVAMAALWGLNIIDASVDAHFFNYDISKDITLRTEPIFNYNPYALNSAGVRLSIIF